MDRAIIRQSLSRWTTRLYLLVVLPLAIAAQWAGARPALDIAVSVAFVGVCAGVTLWIIYRGVRQEMLREAEAAEDKAADDAHRRALKMLRDDQPGRHRVTD